MRLPSHLILAVIISSLSSSVLLMEWLECDPPKSFVIELEDGKKLFVYDAEVNVKYNRNDLAVYEYSGFDDVNILINNTVVSFSGHLLSENKEVDANTPKVLKNFDSKIAGFAKLSKETETINTLIDYNLYLSRNHNEEESNMPKKVQVEIIHEAVSCIKSTINKKIGKITLEDFERAKQRPYNFGSISVLSGNLESLRSKSFKSSIKPKITANDVKGLLSNFTNSNHRILQDAINLIVDLAIAELVEKIRAENDGKIRIPELNRNFSTGSSWWKTSGDFNAFDGTFEDLTTLSRTTDTSLTRQGIKFSASCGIGLAASNMKYRSYTLRYGIAKVSGKLSTIINGVTVLTSGSIDFTRVPCKAVLLDVRVNELGKVKVKITGLGPLNKLLSQLVSWITKKWQDDIVVRVEEELKNIIMKYLDLFDCEKYRPA